MSTPLSQFPKPDATKYINQRKLFLVPNFPFGANLPEKGEKFLKQYWEEVELHIKNLENTLGKATHLYHEMLFDNSDQGLKFIELSNPIGFKFIKKLSDYQSKLEITEDQNIVQENSDWQRCISIGLSSEKVMNLAIKNFQETTDSRWEFIGQQINSTLKKNETGLLFIREDHKIQFEPDIQVFFVAPPALDKLKKWIEEEINKNNQMNSTNNEEEITDK
ncbi:MAG: hypothetical protein CL758_05740 [Chloroflexi bacterium]|nr:hypothetical protein [Chloroflexota bacterium]|tara:strand:- start:237 stop:896 length:660 start_codon:yes stop_codon:yes gene_type:complete